MIKRLLNRAVNALPESVHFRIRDRWWRVKSKLFYQSLYRALQLECTLQSGLTIRVASKGEWWTYNDIFVNGEYDLPIQNALEDCRPGKPFVVLDLGANVGYFALRVVDLMRRKYRERVLEITMVEGNPATFEELQMRIQSQNLPAPASFRMFHGLVGQRSGSAVIRECAVHVMSTIMDDPRYGGVKVEFVDVGSIMEDKVEIDLLKCDIEGAELLFLENYRDLLGKVKHAVFELHHNQCDTDKCVSLLQNSGFRGTVLRANDSFSVNLYRRS